MYQTNLANETTKFTQQSAGLVPSLANVTDGRMSVLALNAGTNISVCCVVFVPGPSAYRLHSHYHYHHSSFLLLVLFRYQLPRSVCCPTLSAQLATCVSPRGTHNHPSAKLNAHERNMHQRHHTADITELIAPTSIVGPTGVSKCGRHTYTFRALSGLICSLALVEVSSKNRLLQFYFWTFWNLLRMLNLLLKC